MHFLIYLFMVFGFSAKVILGNEGLLVNERPAFWSPRQLFGAQVLEEVTVKYWKYIHYIHEDLKI